MLGVEGGDADVERAVVGRGTREPQSAETDDDDDDDGGDSAWCRREIAGDGARVLGGGHEDVGESSIGGEGSENARARRGG